MHMEIRISNNSDWVVLKDFYAVVYKENHPLQSYDFWNWQYGNESYGRAIIAIVNNKVIAHLGLSLSDGYAWHMNLFVDSDYKNSTTLLNLLKIAGEYGKQGNLSANSNAVNLYRSLKWYQYANLERRILLKPGLNIENLSGILKSISMISTFQKPIGHFWALPGLESILFEDGSTGIIQDNIGGLRLVDIVDIKYISRKVFEMGFNWCDFVTSFNNPIIRKLEKSNWQTEEVIEIPWLLNPIVYGNRSNLTFLTKDPIDIKFYIKRNHSDIGRIGSIY